MPYTLRLKGFTLIELLIVISLIGILAGVMLTVINPTAQRNKAQDGTIQAHINKAALAAAGYYSAYGVVPNADNFMSGLTTAATIKDTTDCSRTTSTNYNCLFNVNGIATLPPTSCAIDGFSAGTGQCYFVYKGDSVNKNDFVVCAKSFGSAGFYKYDSISGSLSLYTTGTCAPDTSN